MPHPAGLLLTGGASRRLGVDKAQVRRGAETLAVRSARLLGESCGPLREVGPGVSGLPSVWETPRGGGPLAALLAGAAALGGSVCEHGVVLLACDLVEPAAGLAALAAVPAGRTAIPVDDDGQPQYVCARYSVSALTTARAAWDAGVVSLREVVGRIDPTEVDLLNGFAPDAFADVDTPADAARFGLELPR